MSTNTLKSILSSILADIQSEEVPLVHTLQNLSEDYQDSEYALALKEMRDQVNNGHSMIPIMQKNPTLFPAKVVEEIAKGEESGDLAEALTRAIKLL